MVREPSGLKSQMEPRPLLEVCSGTQCPTMAACDRPADAPVNRASKERATDRLHIKPPLPNRSWIRTVSVQRSGDRPHRIDPRGAAGRLQGGEKSDGEEEGGRAGEGERLGSRRDAWQEAGEEALPGDGGGEADDGAGGGEREGKSVDLGEHAAGPGAQGHADADLVGAAGAPGPAGGARAPGGGGGA